MNDPLSFTYSQPTALKIIKFLHLSWYQEKGKEFQFSQSQSSDIFSSAVHLQCRLIQETFMKRGQSVSILIMAIREYIYPQPPELHATYL